METYLRINMNIHKIEQDIWIADQAWKLIYKLAI